MFYDDNCKTDNEKTVYKLIIELSKQSRYITIQELENCNIPKIELEEILTKFWRVGLFKTVRSSRDSLPLIFSLQELS